MGHIADNGIQKAKKRKIRYERNRLRSKRKEDAELQENTQLQETLQGAETLISLSTSCTLPINPQEQEPLINKSDEKLDDTHAAVNQLRLENKQLKEELIRLQAENQTLKEHIKKCKLDEQFLDNNNTKTAFYTGFPNYQAYLWAVNFCSSVLPNSTVLSKFSVFLLIFMKLRVNLLNLDLAYRFNVSEGLVSRILNQGLPAVAEKLSFLVRWPLRDEVLRTMPYAFRQHYRNCRVIIDCTEIFCERARNLTLRALTWSNYKHHNTVKILVGITPTGAVSFVSKAFGGRVSDKVITQRSGFLDNLEHGDMVLADRGFLIEDDVASRGAKLALPSFTRGKSQLSMKSIEHSRKLARLRIHVERMMERLKNFRILAGILPLSLVPHIDNIVLITAAVSNLHKRLVK